MSSFTALMALSASKTQEQNDLVQRAMQDRQRKEQLMRKQQAERDAKEKEMERKRMLLHFENQRKEQERRKKEEEERRAKEAVLQRRKEEQLGAWLYGPKKAPTTKHSSTPSSSGGGGEARKRKPVDDDDGDDGSGHALTREELRERKQQAELRRLYASSKRSTTSHSYGKSGRRLPGGAVDIMTSSMPAHNSDELAGKSVKDRLAAMPNALTKLNTVKRDTRTIDEIVADIAKKKDGKVLDGEQAKNFDDWFSTKKKDPVKKVQSSSGLSAAGSGSDTPTYNGPSLSSTSPAKKPSTSSSNAVPAKSSVMKTPIAKISSSQHATSKVASNSRAGSLDKQMPSKSSSSARIPRVHERERERERERHTTSTRPSTALGASSTQQGYSKKRPRSESRSQSPLPAKRRVTLQEDDVPGDVRAEIWKIFGRKRDQYVGMDVFSDDEDMEADARVLEREEKLSSKIAKKEDLLALEEEKRHEEEKRRKKKERERLGKPGQL